MTTLKEEEELFGASLSKDFYQSSLSTQNRPWSSSPSHRSTGVFSQGYAHARSNDTSVKDDHMREPFELLDDVPPMFETPRYPVEELYPAVDDIGNGNEGTGWRDDDEDRSLDRSRQSSSVQSSVSTRLNSRYPIDDIISEHSREEDYSCNRSDSYYASSPSRHQFTANDVDVEITESRSDTDSNDYHPMSDTRLSSSEYRTSNEKTEATLAVDDDQFGYSYDDYSADCDMIGTTDRQEKAMDKKHMTRSKASVSSFDRLYNEETGDMDVNYHGYPLGASTIEKYDGHIKNVTNDPHSLATSMSEGSYDYVSPRSNIKQARVDSFNDDYVSPRQNSHLTAMSEDGDNYVSPRENSTWANVQVDVMPNTPKRSNQLMHHRCPASSYATTANSSMSKTTSPADNSSPSALPPPSHPPMPPLIKRPKSRATSPRIVSPSSPSSPLELSPTPPQINRRSMAAIEIFRLHGPDSCRGSSGDHLSEKSDSGAPSSDATSSDSSAIQDLKSNNRQRAIIDMCALRQLKRREDPPTQDFAYYPQNEHAKEPDGFKQYKIFPNVDMWKSKVLGVDRRRVTVNEQVNRHYEHNGHHYNNTKHSIDDSYEDDNEGYFIKNTSQDDPALQDNKECSGKGVEALGYKFRNGHIEREYAHDLGDDSKTDGVSIMSEDTGIQILVKRQQEQIERKHTRTQQKNKPQRKLQQQKSESYYQVKQKDSMESQIKIDPNSNVNGKKARKINQRDQVQTYTDIKWNDSMEKEMSVDFDEHINKSYDKKFTNEEDYALKLPTNNFGDEHQTAPLDSISSPPMIKRKPFSFENADDGVYSTLDYNDNMERFNDYGGSRSIVSDSSYSSRDDVNESCASGASSASETSEASESSDDPAYFPSKAISQMNLGHHNKNDDANESDDLVEKACSHLSRGRNNDAITALTEALQLAESNVNDVKMKLDNHYFQSKRRAKKTDHLPHDELENQLHAALRDSVSEMANVLNNIGVVQETMGDYQLAMNSFRSALDVYRNMCHRYENTGDIDVDRTVNNIMQMGIAARHHDKRMELHDEAEKLAVQTAYWLNSDNQSVCTQLQIKRLNVLMCVMDLETESLGQDHPAVGFTLLKKGELHLEMNHVDMAIKDTRDAVSILKKGLGSIHPEVGLTLVKLADIFNYNVARYGGGCNDGTDNKHMALSLYQEALMPLRESFGNVNPHSGSAYNRLGILYSSRGELKQAMSSFYDALTSYGVRRRADNEMAMESGKRYCSRPEVFLVWINVGGLHMMKNEWHLALRSCLKAHSAFRCLNDDEKRRLQIIAPRQLMRHALPLSQGHSSFDDIDTLIASVLHNVGKAHSMLHQYGKAIETLEEALRMHQVVAIRTTGNKEVFASSYSSRDVARILENLGEVHMIRGDLTSALSRYIESLNLLRSSAYGDDSSIEVALVLGAVGKVHLKKGEFTEAKIVLKESMRMFEKLGVPPNNRRINEIRSNLVDSELALMQNATSTLAAQRREISSVPYVDKALAIDEIADAYRNKGDYSTAIWCYTEALATRRRRIKRRQSLGERRDSSEIVDVGRTISNIAQLRRQRREFGAAKILFDEVKGLYRSVGLSTSHPFFMDLASEIEVMQNM
jgi:tetratricopeptide (TPR) repeat protein